MTLHLLQLAPNPAAIARWFAGQNLLAADGADAGYAWHAALTALFTKALSPKPFRVLSRRGRPPQVLAYSAQPPDALLAAARDFAMPDLFAAMGLAASTLAAKEMPRFAARRRLGFSCLVRPTVRTDRNSDRGQSAEVDVYVAALRKGGDRPDRKAVYAEWARERLQAGGARLIDLRFDGLDQVPVLRRRHATGALHRVEGHSASLAGVLEVASEDAFAALLARGLGRHRAFGFGMLLLSPP